MIEAWAKLATPLIRKVASTAPPISHSIDLLRWMKTSLTTGSISQALAAVAPAITAMHNSASRSHGRYKRTLSRISRPNRRWVG